ncbi:MAG TPA: response regulator [Kofleriaceae bacterium]|nr:response regulator [Kofleriaceae bacterium]
MAQDPYKYFRIEAAELVGELAQGLLDLEKRGDAALVARLLRHAHTLKGAARIVKHRTLADLAHAMEDVLAPLRDAPVAQRLDPALALVDRMTEQLASLAVAAAPAPAPAAPAAAATTDIPALPRFDSRGIDDALGGLAWVHALIARMRATDDRRALARQLDQLDRELREVRRDVEQVRLATAGSMFTALERTARDAAVASGRRVAFASDGDAVRLDAQVLAALHGALVQLVRNAVVHGIEPPAERTAAGKPAEGTVAIAVRSLGRRIAVSCEDDGRGLDIEAIRRAATRRGDVIAGELDAAHAFRLLLRGGISTSREVTELSGRGVGLDVVRDAVHGLGGEITARTRPGGGTAITLAVPVSVAALPVIGVEAGGRTAAIPQAAVRRVSQLAAEQLIAGGDGVALRVGDAVLPCAALATLLGHSTAPRGIAIVVDGGDGAAAISVDRVVGLDDTVVRAVPGHAPIDAIVGGLALDAEGEPYPVLEPRALVEAARAARPIAQAEPARLAPILVVDDSLTTRLLEQSILESAGFAVDVAASAEEALDKLTRASYALALVDVEMPGMDGFALIGELRARPELARLPAILVTSRDAPEDRKRGAAVGAQGYVIKSRFDQAELLAMIDRLVRT